MTDASDPVYPEGRWVGSSLGEMSLNLFSWPIGGAEKNFDGAGDDTLSGGTLRTCPIG